MCYKRGIEPQSKIFSCIYFELKTINHGTNPKKEEETQDQVQTREG